MRSPPGHTATLEVTQGQILIQSPTYMPPDSGGVCMGVDLRNHRFALGLPPGWKETFITTSKATFHMVEYKAFVAGCYVTKFAQHKALKLSAWCKLSFDERVVAHRSVCTPTEAASDLI